MAIVGADVEQLRALSRQFREKADQLESSIVQPLSQNISSAPWKGTDAEAFRQQWQTDLTLKIHQVIESLRAASETAAKNADDQDRTSSVTSGTSASPSGATGTSGGSTQAPSGGSSSGVPNGSTPSSSGRGETPTPAPNGAQPSQGSSSTSARFESFRQQRLGQKVDYDGAYGYQCVDLANQYTTDIFGVPAHSALGGGNAKDIFGNTGEQYFTKVAPSGGPQVGDIVCIGGYHSNPYGHIAVVNAVGADGSITVMEQDGFKQTPAKLRALGATERSAIQGFLRPKADRLK